MPHSLPSAALAKLTDCLYDLSFFGQLDVPALDCDLAFEVDIIPRDCPGQIWFGLVSLDSRDQTPESGFAVRLDLERGEVWDALHDGGLLGELEKGPLGLDLHDEEEPLLLSLRVEKLGGNLLPSLRIGGKQFLYPALAAGERHRLTAIAGALQPGRDAAPFCLYPAVWMTAKR